MMSAEGQGTALPERAVVTCFLLRRRPTGDRLLLVKRSQRVSTFAGLWAGISGSIETTPTEQALTEIREETGLAPPAITLLATGEPLTVDDPAHHCRWRIHPFLVLVADEAVIQLDWEQSESRWVRPSEIAQLPTVPRLAEALARVYLPPSQAAAGPVVGADGGPAGCSIGPR